MRLRMGRTKILVIVVVALSLLLTGSIAYAAQKSATVMLSPKNSGLMLMSAAAGATGQVTIVSTSGPGGGTTLTVTVDNTVADTTYALWVGRDGRSFRLISLVTWITGNGGAVTVDGVQMEKAPTNGQSFQLVDLTTGQVVAISDPIRY